MREPRFKRLAEHRQPFGKLHPVEPELHLVVVATDMDLAKRILSHAGSLQQHLVERRVVALRQGLETAAAKTIYCCSKIRLESAPGAIQPHADLLDAGGRIDAVGRAGAWRGRDGRLPGGNDRRVGIGLLHADAHRRPGLRGLSHGRCAGNRDLKRTQHRPGEQCGPSRHRRILPGRPSRHRRQLEDVCDVIRSH